MIHFTTFFALVVGGMEVIQPAAAGVLAGLSPFGLMNTFQRRQTAPPIPPQCTSVCNSVNTIAQCTPAVCCLSSFEMSYFNCFTCAEAAANVTDFSEAQTILDTLYDDCASLGIQLPILTFPGQNPDRPLSSLGIPISTVSSNSSLSSIISQSTVSSISSLPSQPIITQSTVGPSTSSTPATTSVNTPTSTSSVSSGIRYVETSFSNLITVAMMLGTWLYFAA